MVDKMENYLNIIHFVLYRMINKLHLITERFNPVNLIHKLPFQRKRYEELGIDIHDEINKIWGDKQFGLSIQAAGGLLWGGLGLFFFSLSMLFNFQISILLLFGCAILSGAIYYVFIFRDDKYLIYFKKYENCSRNVRRKYNWLTVGSIFLVLLSFYTCLVI